MAPTAENLERSSTTLFQRVMRLSFRDRTDLRDGAILTALMFGAATFEAVGIGIVMPFVSLLAHPEIVQKYSALVWVKRTTGVTTHVGLVTALGALLVAVFVLKNVYLLFVQYAQAKYVYQRQIRVENELFETYLRRPWTFHLQHNSSELIHAVSVEVSQVFTHVVTSVFVVAVEGLSLVVIGLLLVFIEPVAVPAVGVTLGLTSVGFYRLVHRRATRIGERQRKMQAEMLRAVQQGLGGVKESRLLGSEDYFVREYTRRSTPFARSLVLHRMLGLAPRYVLETTGILALVLITVAMYARGAEETRILPVLGALAVASVRILPSTSHIIGSISLIRFVKPSVDALWTALEPWPGDGQRGTRGQLLEPLPMNEHVRLRDVRYTYPGAPGASLAGVDLTIRRGESVALVGGSGAGKTTLVDVLIGLLTPQAGAVEVDGKELSGNEMQRWQRSIGYIPQTVFLSDDTIRRNVAFGVDDDSVDGERLAGAVAAARLDELVSTLPEGLDTFVGERGVRLSGGQRQRIGIARALYLDPKVLVLDEATASLDGVTESEIVDAVERLRRTRTMLIVAHRLSTVRTCDRIVLMGNGEILDAGTWDALITRSAPFRRLVELARLDEPKAS